MFWFTLITLAAVSIDGVVCGDCRVDPRRTILCSTHLDEEQSVLREERSIMARSKERSERAAALERVAALTEAHVNAPSSNVARFLADGLHDDAVFVRRRALALLLDGQHRDETIKGVLDGWKAAQREWRDMDVKLLDEIGKGAFTLTRDELDELPSYFVALIGALGATGDERAYRELLGVFKLPLDHTPGRFYVAAARAALSLESRRGLESVLDFALSLESDLVADRVPRRFGPDQGLLSSLLEPLDNARPIDVEDILDAVAAFASTKQLAAPPDARLGDPSAWRAWFKDVRDGVSDRLAPLE